MSPKRFYMEASYLFLSNRGRGGNYLLMISLLDPCQSHSQFPLISDSLTNQFSIVLAQLLNNYIDSYL